jgi:hypothetical protein
VEDRLKSGGSPPVKEVEPLRRQKGQAIVEFALVLPLFFLFFWGMIYIGLLYSDYLTLSNWARESARYASIEGAGAAVTEFQREARSPALLTNLYQWKGASSFAIAGGDDSSTSVSVTVTVDLNHSFPGVGVMDFVGAPLPEQYKIFYSMHKEPSS